MIYHKDNYKTSNPRIPNVSNPSHDTILEHGWLPYINEPPEYDSETHKAVKCDVVVEDDKAVQHWDVVELSAEDKNQRRQSVSVSRRQFFLGITFFEHNGSPLKRQIEALIDNLEDPQKTILKTEYQQASSFDRLNPSVLAIAEALEISEQTMDEFFDYCLNEKWG